MKTNIGGPMKNHPIQKGVLIRYTAEKKPRKKTHFIKLKLGDGDYRLLLSLLITFIIIIIIIMMIGKNLMSYVRHFRGQEAYNLTIYSTERPGFSITAACRFTGGYGRAVPCTEVWMVEKWWIYGWEIWEIWRSNEQVWGV